MNGWGLTCVGLSPSCEGSRLTRASDVRSVGIFGVFCQKETRKEKHGLWLESV